MTKKIIEWKKGDELLFKFIDLWYDEDIYFISDILESEFKAEFVDISNSYSPSDLYFFRTFKIDEIEFNLNDIFHEGLYLSLRRQNEEDNAWLRNLANEVLNVIKERGPNYLTETAKARQTESWVKDQTIIHKRFEELKKNRENRKKKKW